MSSSLPTHSQPTSSKACLFHILLQWLLHYPSTSQHIIRLSIEAPFIFFTQPFISYLFSVTLVKVKYFSSKPHVDRTVTSQPSVGHRATEFHTSLLSWTGFNQIQWVHSSYAIWLILEVAGRLIRIGFLDCHCVQFATLLFKLINVFSS